MLLKTLQIATDLIWSSLSGSGLVSCKYNYLPAAKSRNYKRGWAQAWKKPGILAAGMPIFFLTHRDFLISQRRELFNLRKLSTHPPFRNLGLFGNFCPNFLVSMAKIKQVLNLIINFYSIFPLSINDNSKIFIKYSFLPENSNMTTR